MTREEILAVAKPILFNTEMVQALLDDRKHVTRRVVKQAVVDKFVLSEDNRLLGNFDACHPEWGVYPTVDDAPYQPGGLLYVRETWTKLWYVDAGGYTHFDQPMYYYAADGDPCITLYDEDGFEMDDQRIRWRPSIHMPKEIARIFLRVTDMWVERLQDISRDDTAKEGAPCCLRLYGGYCGNGGLCDCDDYKKEFVSLWDSTIPKKDLFLYGWEANPWVWVIEFEKEKIS